MDDKILFTDEEKELLSTAIEALDKITDRIAVDTYADSYRLWNCYIELVSIKAINCE